MCVTEYTIFHNTYTCKVDLLVDIYFLNRK